jgi:hypothetical protein
VVCVDAEAGRVFLGAPELVEERPVKELEEVRRLARPCLSTGTVRDRVRAHRTGDSSMIGSYPVTFSVDYPDRNHNRVVGYAFALVTDQYPPFRLAP